MIQILGISGSIRKASTNTKMLHTVAALGKGRINMPVFCALDTLPPYNPDLDLSGRPLHDSVVRFRQTCEQAQAVLFACPEYGHGIPGVLKNALDWLVSSGEINQKPVAVTNAYSNRARGWSGLESLIRTLRAMDSTITGCNTPEQALSEANLVQNQVRALIAAVQTSPA
ncbi:MAG: NAD(P)H-dependent oxidoreductase [Leptospiraceae bacterium]|nr:NAD(P)H-dependent oxidoreductase [Leptospiraceae bacterium]